MSESHWGHFSEGLIFLPGLTAGPRHPLGRNHDTTDFCSNSETTKPGNTHVALRPDHPFPYNHSMTQLFQREGNSHLCPRECVVFASSEKGRCAIFGVSEKMSASSARPHMRPPCAHNFEMSRIPATATRRPANKLKTRKTPQ